MNGESEIHRDGPRALAMGFVVAIVLISGMPLGAETMELIDLDPSRVRWSELAYRAKKLTFSAGTELSLSSVASTLR